MISFSHSGYPHASQLTCLGIPVLWWKETSLIQTPFLKPIYLAAVNKVAVKEGAVSQYLISNSHCKCNRAQGAEHLMHSGTTFCFFHAWKSEFVLLLSTSRCWQLRPVLLIPLEKVPHAGTDGDGHQQSGAFTSGLNTNFLGELSGATVSSCFHISGSRARIIFTNFTGPTRKIN